MTKALSYIGQQSRYILLLALVLAALLPSVSSALRPLLPVLVSLVLGLSIARLDIASVLLEYKDIKRLVLLLGVVLTFIPLTAFLLVYGWRLLGFNENYTLLLVVFAGAPPLGSATALSLLLGYNARITLQVTLLATVLTPFLGPMCLALIGVSIDASLSSVAMNIFLMIAGGFALGLVLQRVIGKQRIANNPDVFNGFATIGMVCSLFPLFDGVTAYVAKSPVESVLVLALAILLNTGGNVLGRFIGRKVTNSATANALGLMFGNRNVAFYLAALPLNPLLSIFIAASQFPMFATPAIFGKWDKGRY